MRRGWQAAGVPDMTNITGIEAASVLSDTRHILLCRSVAFSDKSETQICIQPVALGGLVEQRALLL
jgi:hypothetical protein